MTDTPIHSRDRTQRFLFEQADIRGEVVQLDASFRDIIAIHQYPPGVSHLMGEFMAATVLLATTLKFEGKLVLQARSEGQIPLLMVECDNELNLRAIARGAQEATSDRFDQLLTGGQLAITIDPKQGNRYQGIVPLGEDSLAHCLESYFRQSEQLGTRFWLAASQKGATGMLLQQLPAQLVEEQEDRQQQWQHACTLADTVKDEELLDLPAPTVIHRLFHQDPVRLFEPLPVAFSCNCSRERTLNALASIPKADIQELLEELGSITMDCEFCNQQYRFVRDDLEHVLGPNEDPTVH